MIMSVMIIYNILTVGSSREFDFIVLENTIIFFTYEAVVSLLSLPTIIG